MAGAHSQGSRLLRWTGSARWVAIGACLAVVAAATSGTIAAVGPSNSGFGGHAQNASCAQYEVGVNFRFHYSASGSSGSWSGTTGTSCTNGTTSVTIGPQDMEGDQKLAPGDL